MQFEYKDQTLTFPASLSEITLGKRVGFYNTYGKALDERAMKVQALPAGMEQELERDMLELDAAISTFSYYTGIPLEEAKANISLADLMTIYSVGVQVLYEQERDIALQPSYDWNGETWVIAAPELEPDSSMTLIEFVTAKEVVRQLAAVGKGKWDALPYLCAVYLRKEGEVFSEDLVSEGNERLKLMDGLPLDMALSVAFFLSGTLSIYSSTLVSSQKEEAKESTPAATSTSGDGSPS